MNKTKMFKKVICFVVASMMLIPSLPSSIVSAVVDTSIDVGGNVTVDKTAYKVDGATDKDYWIQFDINGTDTIINPTPLDVVLVLDRSGSMSGSRISTLKTAANNFISDVLANNSNNRVSILTFSDGSSGYTQTDFTDNANTLNSAVNAMSAYGDTNTGVALNKAKAILDQSKISKPDSKRVLVLFTDGAPAPSGYEVDYAYSKNATIQARAIQASYPELPMYCVYWDPGVGSGENFWLDDDIPRADVTDIGSNNFRENTWGKTLEKYSGDCYLRINNKFILNTLLPTFVSDPDNLIEASTDPTELNEVFDGITGSILSFANTVSLSDIVKSQNFDLNIGTTGSVQYRPTVVSGSNNNTWENLTSISSQLAYYSVGANNDVTMNFDKISQPGLEVRFKIKLKDGVYSANGATVPDLDTNESAKITFIDALGVAHDNVNIPIFPKVLVPNQMVAAKVVKVDENGNPLVGATFAVDKQGGGGERVVQGLADKGVGNNEFPFVIDTSNNSAYIIKEIVTPTGYESDLQFNVQLTSDGFRLLGNPPDNVSIDPNDNMTVIVQNIKDEDQWHTVTFEAGANGSLTGTKSYDDILDGTAWPTAVTAVPTPVADPGYKFNGWTPATFATTVTTDLLYTANFTVTTIEIPVSKVWIGNETETVTVNLMDGETVAETIILSGPEWYGTFEAPKFDGQSKEIQYTVKEVNVDGYLSEVTINDDGCYIITNTETTDIHVQKDWSDDERPKATMLMKSATISNTKPDIKIRLWVGNEKIDDMTFFYPITSGIFYNVPIYDKNGVPINYTITEDPVEGYDSEVEFYDSDHFVYVTNTLKKFAVNYNANGGSGTTPDEELYKYGSDVETIINPFEKTGNTFAGWNTEANGTGTLYVEEEIFQMPATGVTLFAQWTPNTGINYTVYYVDEDTNINLDSKVVGGQVFGDTVTESAIDFVGYVKQDPTSQSITLGESDNVIKFYYKVRTDIEYVVNYLESGTNNVLAEQKVVTDQKFGDEVTEQAKDISDYNKAGRIEKTITLGVDENVINFYYTEYEVIGESDFYTINWNYETGHNTNDYDQRYTTDGEGSVSDITNYVQLHYDSGYTYSNFATSKYVVEKIVDTTTSSAITGSAITGTAIVYEITTTVELYYDRNGSSNPDKPVIITDPEIPLAELEKLDHFAYVIGYPEGDVRPLNNITREEVAMIFYRLLTDESRDNLLSDANPFTDMTSDRWSNRAISTLYNAGILEGYLDGTFKPSDPISRAEFATIAAKFDKLELSSNSKFTDIAGHWAEKYITSSEVKGWIKGYEDNTFRPDQDITRAESMTLINNVLGRAVPEENIHPDAMFWPDNLTTAWYYEAIEEATNSHDYIYEEDGDELWTGLKANKVWP